MTAEPLPQPSSPERDSLDAAVQEDLKDLFRLEMLYARGPASRLYVARDLEYNQPVALKVMPRSAQAWDRAEEAFHEAAAAAAVLTHPRAAPLYSAGATDRFFWHSTEFVPGRSLADLLRAGPPMELDACIKVAEQIAAALDAAHRLGIVHADLKPTNVLLDAAGDVHVTDFWIRWVLEQLGALVGEGDAKDGEARGWPGPYLSPEQRVGREPGPAADQYALAALVYECLAGTPPPAEDPMAAIADGRSPAPAPRLTDIRPDVPSVTSAAVERALSQSPDGRFATAGSFVAALRAPAHQEVSHARSDARWAPVEVAPVEERPARHGIGLVPLALLAFVIVGAAGAAWILGLGLTTGQPIASQPAPTPPAAMEPSPAPSTFSAVPLPDSTVRTTEIPVSPTPARPAPARSPAPIKRAPPARLSSPRAPRRDATVAKPGRLFVNATPWGQVFVDNELIGNTPRVGVPITSGTHRVRVSRDGFEPFERTVQVGPGQDVRLTNIVLRESKP
ncbi:MAG TPA: protein kinase [Gemmatimonadales bacterium]|nr:protein kinase [Gemmatimonadales bacterium]